MTITVLDTYSAMKQILRAPATDRVDLLRSMLEPVSGMFRYFPGEVDLVAMHRMASGFPLDREEERCLDALQTLATAHAWERMQNALDQALAVQLAATPELTVPDITVLVVLGDPGDAHFMGPSLGLTGNGGISGYILITLWPFPENVARLEATAVHELNHNLRYGPGGVVWDPMTVTVGEHVVSEGLADAFARQLYGDELGYARIGVSPLHDDAVFAKVVTGLDVTGMQNFTAWVHGDTHAERFGAPRWACRLERATPPATGWSTPTWQRQGKQQRRPYTPPARRSSPPHSTIRETRTGHAQRLLIGPFTPYQERTSVMSCYGTNRDPT